MTIAKIAVIEDEQALRQSIAEELEEAGYKVVEAADGRQGLELILAERPDLVLCDIMMPELNGYQVLEQLRGGHPDLADTAFLFLSALTDRAAIIEGKSLGADDYITKPIDFEMLQATVFARLRQVFRMKARQTGEAALRPDEAPPAVQSEAEVRALVGRHGAKTALVVCGDGGIYRDLSGQLARLGLKTVWLRSGRQFAEMIQDYRPDLVFLSYYTEDMQAPLVVKMAGVTEGRRAFPLVLLKPRSMIDMPHAQTDRPFDGVLMLPAGNDAVTAMVGKCLAPRA